MSNGWTLERRQRQAEMIKSWRPWEKSTGPKSSEGKKMVSRNAWRGNTRAQLRQLSKELNEVLADMRQVMTHDCTAAQAYTSTYGPAPKAKRDEADQPHVSSAG